MKEFYEEYWSSPKPSPVGDPLSAARRRLIWQHVGEAIPRPGRILEIGCGDGGLVGEAILRGHAAVGADLSEVAVAPEGGHVRFFADRGLVRLLTEEGFNVVTRAHLGRAPLVWANTLLVGRKLT